VLAANLGVRWNGGCISGTGARYESAVGIIVEAVGHRSGSIGDRDRAAGGRGADSILTCRWNSMESTRALNHAVRLTKNGVGETWTKRY
jgi:hypothetical protein